MTNEQIKAWRKAYPEIDISDDVLLQWAECASLYGADYLIYLESKGNEAAPFLRVMMRELVWVYGNWQKAQRDGSPKSLIMDLLNASSFGGGYEFTQKFLRDYAKANNIPVDAANGNQPFDFSALPKGEISAVP